MSNEFNYKGYSGSCTASIEDNCLHGRILFIDDLITYEGDSIPELETSFKNAVDEYIDYCEKTGKPANKPYSGTFNVRIGPELHKLASQCATSAGIKLNEFVRGAIFKAVNLNRTQHEIKPNEHEIAESTSEKTLPLNLIQAIEQKESVTSAGYAGLMEDPIITLSDIPIITATKGVHHGTTH